MREIDVFSVIALKLNLLFTIPEWRLYNLFGSFGHTKFYFTFKSGPSCSKHH